MAGVVYIYSSIILFTLLSAALLENYFFKLRFQLFITIFQSLTEETYIFLLPDVKWY